MSADARRRALVVALPFAVFGALLALTWQRWVHPFQDSGREVGTAVRLAAGEVLYRDVAYLYGPLPPLLDALAMRVLGRHADALVALRILVGLLGVEALRRLARRLSGDPLLGAAIATFVVATCAFGVHGAWPFPYSVAALEGSVALWWGLELALGGTREGLFAAGLLAGLAAGTKVELLPAAVLVPLAALGRRPGREVFRSAAAATLLAAAAWGVPVALFGAATMERAGYLVALRNPEPWRRVQEAIFFGGQSRDAFLHGGWLGALFPSLPFLAGAGLLASRVRGSAAAPLAFALGLLGLLVPQSEELHALLLAAPAVVVAEAVAAWRRRARADQASDTLRAAGPALLLLWRQPFFLRVSGYLLAAPLALVVVAARLGRLLPPARAAALLLGLAAAQVADRAVEYRAPAGRWERLELPGARIRLPGDEALFLRELVGAVRRETPEGSWVAGLPEPGFVLFLAGRRSPFVDELFYPGCQDAAAQALMLQRLARRPLAAFVELDRATPEYGPERPRHGVLDRVLERVDASLPRVLAVGRPDSVPRSVERYPVGAWLRLPAAEGSTSSATTSTSPAATGMEASRSPAGSAAARARAIGVRTGWR